MNELAQVGPPVVGRVGKAYAAEDLVDGQVENGSREAARAEVWRQGRTPAGEPAFVGVTNGEPVRLLYDVEVYLNTTRGA